MSVLAECPVCHKKQSLRNKACKCGMDLDKAKKAKKVRYYIVYRINGKQKWEFVGTSVSEAKDADGKRKVQKRENRIFEILPDARMTMKELAGWYTGLESIRALTSFDRVTGMLQNFNDELGAMVVGDIKPVDVENYQGLRESQGASPATIDMELSRVGSMIRKAFDNDMVSGHTLKVFRSVKPKLKKGANARRQLLGPEEYVKLLEASRAHLKPILIVAYNTGMRKGELRKLTWAHVDLKAGFLRLPAAITKEGKPKSVPINHNVREALEALPRAINHDFVFTYHGKHLANKSAFKRSFRTACKDAGIPFGRKTEGGVTFHDIRRTVKTSMLNAGMDKAHRNMILGHTQEGMDAYYLVPTEESLTKAMDRYTAWLDEAVSEVLAKALDKKKKASNEDA